MVVKGQFVQLAIQSYKLDNQSAVLDSQSIELENYNIGCGISQLS